MKITEILVESKELKEGPILNKIGTAVGRGAGAAAKAVGAVAGGVAGLGKAIKKGFQAGKATVGGADDDESTADAGTSNTAAPAAGASTTTTPTSQSNAAPAQKSKPQSTFGKLNKAAAGGEEPAAPVAVNPATKGTSGSTGGGVTSIGPVTQTTDAPEPAKAGAAKQNAAQDDAASGTAYAQAQKAVKSLPPEQQKEIVTMLQADPKVKAAMSKPAAKPAAPSAMGSMAKDLTAQSPATTPSSTGGTTTTTSTGKVHKAGTGNPNAQSAATATAEPVAKKGKARKKAAGPSQAEIDADRERIMGPTSDSVIRKGSMVAENFSLFRKY